MPRIGALVLPSASWPAEERGEGGRPPHSPPTPPPGPLAAPHPRPATLRHLVRRLAS
ncbi:hypothetical protein B5X24_HaOG211837 [Helicoverpa armigera]|nr:hypothetical protein B5X24_HaOG211837 [Helicoverpa armigera]